MAHNVIMPMLGMNQNTGKILSWLKGKGDSVSLGDPLMEVETDKAVVEVEAQASGVLTEVRYTAGSEVPVGHVVAVIGDGVAATLAFSGRAAPSEQTAAPSDRANVTENGPVPTEHRPTLPIKPEPSEKSIAPPAMGRLLISPKARKEAARRGLDLHQLSKLAKGPPYHMADLDGLQTEVASPSPAGVVANMMEFEATIDVGPTLSLVEWIGKETGKRISLEAIWAAFAAGSLGGGARRIRVQTLRGSQDYVITPYQSLSQIVPADDADDAVDLFIHDLSESRLSRARIGSGRAPTLTLESGTSIGKMTLRLNAYETQLSQATAMRFLDSLVRRAESPIRHVL